MPRTMRGLGWTEADLISRLKNDSGKLAMAARVRKETTLPIKWIGSSRRGCALARKICDLRTAF